MDFQEAGQRLLPQRGDPERCAETCINRLVQDTHTFCVQKRSGRPQSMKSLAHGHPAAFVRDLVVNRWRACHAVYPQSMREDV
jgi:hypothetical protein